MGNRKTTGVTSAQECVQIINVDALLHGVRGNREHHSRAATLVNLLNWKEVTWGYCNIKSQPSPSMQHRFASTDTHEK